MAKNVWIKNTGAYTLNVDYFLEGLKKTKSFPARNVFYLTGQEVHNGYTSLPEEEYEEILKNSKFFNKYLERKVLVKSDKGPVTAFSDTKELKAELAQVKAEKEALAADVDKKAEEVAKEKLVEADKATKAAKEKLVEADKATKAAEEKATKAQADLESLLQEAGDLLPEDLKAKFGYKD